jgi:hypothetical protein
MSVWVWVWMSVCAVCIQTLSPHECRVVPSCFFAAPRLSLITFPPLTRSPCSTSFFVHTSTVPTNHSPAYPQPWPSASTQNLSSIHSQWAFLITVPIRHSPVPPALLAPYPPPPYPPRHCLKYRPLLPLLCRCPFWRQPLSPVRVCICVCVCVCVCV